MSREDVGGGVIASWAERLAQSLEAMTGERPQTAVRPAAQAPSSDLLWWEQTFSGLPGARLFVGAPEETWRQTGLRVLRAAGIDEAESTAARSTYLEVVAQACAGLARDLGTRCGQEVSCEEGNEAAAPPPALEFFGIEVAPAGEALPALWAAFEPGPLRPGEAEPPEREKSALAPPAVRPKPNPKTLDLLMEVELPVSVSFGRAQMPLKDVLKLTTGSIVELNRGITEPVEVIVNNCVVARGEVVVVDGNYGVRIHQIVSRDERLRTLK